MTNTHIFIKIATINRGHCIKQYTYTDTVSYKIYTNIVQLEDHTNSEQIYGKQKT